MKAHAYPITDYQGPTCPDKTATPDDRTDAPATAYGYVRCDESASAKHDARRAER